MYAVFEFIRQNEWLSKKDFWIGYCSWLVEEELLKIGELLKISLSDIKSNKTFSEKISNKISDVLFSQLLPSLTNMLEITNNKTYAVEIIYLFQEKYIYFRKDNVESLFNMVSNDKEEVQKLRKEYELKKEENKGEKKEEKNLSLKGIETNETMNMSGSDLDFNSSKNLNDIIKDKNSNLSIHSLNGEENINYNLIIEEDKESNEDDNPNKIIVENPDKNEKDTQNSININNTDNLNKIEDKTSNIFDDFEEIKKEDIDDYSDIKKSFTLFQIIQRKIKKKDQKK